VAVGVWGLEVSEAKRLRTLEEENAKLKKPAGGVDDGRVDAPRDTRKSF
jgi:hypothetical protein